MNNRSQAWMFRLFSLLMAALITSQCTGSPAIREEATQPIVPISDPAATSAEVPPAVETVPTTADVPLTLGGAEFTIDPSFQAEGQYLDDGSDLQLQLTDRSGLTWTLTIPAQVALAPQTIRMTALKDIRSADIPGTLAGGVLLEPDGLLLDTPAKLTVTGAALRGTTLLLGGQQDGSQVGFLMVEPAEDGASALLDHFSSYLGDDLTEDSDVDQIGQSAVDQYLALMEQARQLLKTNIVAPTPPKMAVTCTSGEEGEKNDQQLKDFLKAFDTPEGSLLRQMLAASKTIQLTTNLENLDYSLMTQLVERQADKAKMLILGYGEEVEYLPALASVAIQTAFMYELLGGSGSTAELMGMVAALYEQAIDKLLEKLAKEHDYRMADSIMTAARMSQLMGSNADGDASQLLQKIINAMHFDVDLKYTLNLTGNQHWVLQAGFPVELTYIGETMTLKGSGTGVMSSFTHDDWPELYAVIPDFSVSVVIKDWDACEGTAKMTVDQFYPGTETYRDDSDPEHPLSAENTLLRLSWEGIFSERLVEGVYTFTLSPQNGNIVAVETSDQGRSDEMNGQFDGTFEIKLTHSPIGN